MIYANFLTILYNLHVHDDLISCLLAGWLYPSETGMASPGRRAPPTLLPTNLPNTQRPPQSWASITFICFEKDSMVFFFMIQYLQHCENVFSFCQNIHTEFCDWLVQWDLTSFEVYEYVGTANSILLPLLYHPLFFNSERMPWSFKPWTSSTESYCTSINKEIVHLSMKEIDQRGQSKYS